MNNLSFQANPYLPVVLGDNSLIIPLDSESQLSIPDSPEARFALTAQEELSLERIREVFGDDVALRLFGARVLLPVAPAVSGRHSRTEGFFSLLPRTGGLDRLHHSSVLILGAGAVGTHVAWALAALGISRIVVVDFDQIDVSNLNRQAFYTESDIGQNKVDVLARELRKVHPSLLIEPVNQHLRSEEEVVSLLRDVGPNLIVRAADTPTVMGMWVNRAALTTGVPFVSGGFLGVHGTVGPTVTPGRGPCLECFPDDFDPEVHRISGVAPTSAPLTQIVAGTIANEAMLVLSGHEPGLRGTVRTIDAATSAVHDRLLRPERCERCGGSPAPVPIQSASWLPMFAFATSLALPFAVSLPGWNAWFTLILIAAQQAALVRMARTARFRLIFTTGTVFGLVSALLNLRLNGAAAFGMNITEAFFTVRVMFITLIMLCYGVLLQVICALGVDAVSVGLSWAASTFRRTYGHGKASARGAIG